MTIPNKELVGKNARAQKDVYSDDYLKALNKFATVDEVFGEHKRKIANGENIIGALVMDTLGRSEWENHLVAIVMNAAKAGEWRAVVREPGMLVEGLDEITKKHFGFVVKHKGKKYLIPSALYVTYCQAQLE